MPVFHWNEQKLDVLVSSGGFEKSVLYASCMNFIAQNLDVSEDFFLNNLLICAFLGK